MANISVVLPAYKEADNLKKLLPKIRSVLEEICENWEILVVDAMEPTGDNTEEVCLSAGATYLPRRGGNLYGDAIRTGFKDAKYEYIVVLDADCSHHPEDIKRMLNTIEYENADLIIGSRYMKGGYTDNPWILRFMSYVLNVTYRVMFHLKVKDVSDSYRLYRAEKVKAIHLECDNFDIVEEILIMLRIKFPKIKIIEIPVSFEKRDQGTSKRDLKKFILSYLTTMRKLLSIQRRNR